jgi:hypothetical protein
MLGFFFLYEQLAFLRCFTGQCVDAFARAPWQAGVVHMDLRPANIMYRPIQSVGMPPVWIALRALVGKRHIRIARSSSIPS